MGEEPIMLNHHKSESMGKIFKYLQFASETKGFSEQVCSVGIHAVMLG